MGGLSRWLVRTKFGLLCLVGIEVFGCEASVTSCSAMVGSRACFAELWLSGAMTARVRCTDVCLEERLCLHRAPPHSVFLHRFGQLANSAHACVCGSDRS